MKKQSLIILLKNKFSEIPEKELLAKILCGEVLVKGETVKDHNRKIDIDSEIEFTGAEFVSRGGIKLAHALKTWGIDVSGKVILDGGSSTGGFTHCLLKSGASKVYAVDVGFNQLHNNLKKDSRVISIEQTNIMDLEIENLDPVPDAAVIDLSFRSIKGVIPKILPKLRSGWIVSLVKPQFEYKEDNEDFDGVIKDNEIISSILHDLVEFFFNKNIYVKNITESPIRGRKGNREYFFYFVKDKVEFDYKKKIMDLLNKNFV